MAQPSVHGRFIWQELMTDDPAMAAEFYSKVIGWRTRTSAVDAAYTELLADGRPVGGMMRLSHEAHEHGARAHWLPYVGVSDVDATVSLAERLGAKVLRASTDIESVGRFAVLADPQGAAFAIFASQGTMSTGDKPSLGEASWQELASSDYETAFEFYRQLFGWEVLSRMDMGPAGTYMIFGSDGVQRGGMYKLSAQMSAPYWLSYISVPSADKVAAAAKAAGGRVINGPMDVPGGGRIAQMFDPGGVLFAVHSAASAAPAKGAAKKAVARQPAELAARKPEIAKAAAQGAGARKSVGATHKPGKKGARKAVKQAPKKAAGKRTAAAAKKAAKAPQRAARKAATRVVRKAVKKAKRVTGRGTARKSVAKAKAAKRAHTRVARKTRRRPASKK